MKKELTIILAEDDEGHATLIKRNLKRSGLLNEIIHFKDGQETLDFLNNVKDKNGKNNLPSLLLLDIKMPKVNGIEVLRQVKQDPSLKKMPVIMITTTDDPRGKIATCHELGCSNYITKPSRL